MKKVLSVRAIIGSDPSLLVLWHETNWADDAVVILPAVVLARNEK